MHRRFIRQIPPLGMLHQIDFADQIGDGHVRGGELLVITIGSMHPLDRGVVAMFADQLLPRFGRWLQRIIVDFSSRQHRHPLIEQFRQQRRIAVLA